MSSIYAANDEKNLVVINANGNWVSIDTFTNDVIGVSSTFSFPENEGWTQTPTASAKNLKVYLELAESATTSLTVKEHDADSFNYNRTVRVPKAVKAEGVFTNDTATLREIYDYTLTDDYTFATNTTNVSAAWVERITAKNPRNKHAMAAAGFIPDPNCFYFGVPADVDTPFIITSLIKYDPATDEWTIRTPEHWDPILAGLPEFLVELDADSALQLALHIDKPDYRDSDTINYADIYPEEAGVFFAAEAELDMETLDRVFDIYDSQERSVNAKKQVRGAGGRFGPGGATSKETAPIRVKARLPQSLPIVDDVNALIQQYLVEINKQRFKGQEQPDDFAVSADAAGVAITDVKPLYLAIVDDIDPDAVLDVIALVPPKKGAQGDVSAWKRDNGQWISAPEVLQQLRGSTPPSVVKLEDEALLKNVLVQVDKATAAAPAEEAAPGATPTDPATGDVVEPAPITAAFFTEEELRALGEAELAKNIDRKRAIKEGWSLPDGSFPIRNKEDLKRAVKAYGRAKDKTKAKNHIKRRARALDATDLLPDTWSMWDIVRGFAFVDGSLTIHDVTDLREAVEFAQTEDHVAHVVKRARALNRLDVLPYGWDASVEQPTDLWGPFGELVAAGGIDRNRGNAEALRRYWTKGPGAAKIGWTLKGGAWTRCVSHLSKYLGPRAKGYCALRFHEVLGVWPGDEANRG